MARSAPGPVPSLRPMTEAEFESWRQLAIINHAQQMSTATGRDLEVSREEASQLLRKVLVRGLETPGMNFFVLVDDAGRIVGWLWLGSSPQDADAGFVWDIIIDESHRGRGYGRAAMVAAERFFAQQGKLRMGLQVAAGNHVARHLYESLGYHNVMTTMSKELGPGLSQHRD